MITSDIQYAATKKQLTLLLDSLSSPKKKAVPDLVERAARTQLQELIAEIQASIDEYDTLKKTSPSDIKIFSLDDLMTVPIRYRIAAQRLEPAKSFEMNQKTIRIQIDVY